MDSLRDVPIEKLIGQLLTFESNELNTTNQKVGLSLTLRVSKVVALDNQWQIEFEKAAYFSEATLESNSIIITPEAYELIPPASEADITLSFVRKNNYSAAASAEITLAGLTHLAFAHL